MIVCILIKFYLFISVWEIITLGTSVMFNLVASTKAELFWIALSNLMFNIHFRLIKANFPQDLFYNNH